MEWLAKLCVTRPVFTWVLMFIIMVLGAVCYRSLGLDKYPKIDIPTVVITTTLSGAAPEEIETELSDKVEEAVNTISGVDQISSISSEGVSVVVVSFVLEKDGDVAAQEVRDHVGNATPTLPNGIDPPVVSKFDPDSSPIFFVTLEGPGTIRGADPRRAVRVVAAPGHDPRLSAADGPLCVAVASAFRAAAHDLLRPRPPRALWRSEEKFDPPNRSHHSLTRRRFGPRGSDPRSQSRSIAAHSHDDHRVRRRDVAALVLARSGARVSTRGSPASSAAVKRSPCS